MRAVAITVAALAGCTAPKFGDGHLQCASTGRACPAGYYCAADNHCWHDGNGPGGDDMSAPGDLASALFDLAAGDLATAVTPSKCATSDAQLCESFESPTALSNWTIEAPMGYMQRDTTRAYRGVASVHANITGAAVNTNPRSVITETSTFPNTTTIYVRVWAYFPSPLPQTFNQSIELETASGGVTAGVDSGRVTLNDYASPQYYKSSATMMPLDRWTCLQLDLPQTGTSGPVHLTVDGTPLDDIAATNVTTPAISFLGVGLDLYGNSVPIAQYDAWFDEIIVDTKPTTCAE